MLCPTFWTALVVLLTLVPVSPAIAEAKCEVKTNTCIDARTGQARICSTTICKDDKGEIVSINTIVLKDAGQAQGATGPKVKPQLDDLNVTKQIDKSSS